MDRLIIHVLNVGKGDCIVLERQQDEHRAFGVIDCNSTKRRPSPAKDKLLELGAEKLSFVVITHPDKDHYSGILDVLNEFQDINEFYTFPIFSLEKKDNIKKLADRYRERLQAGQGDSQQIVDAGVELIEILKVASERFLSNESWINMVGMRNAFAPVGFHGVSMNILQPPPKVKGIVFEAIKNGKFEIENQASNNELSAALHVEFGGRTVLLGGDSTYENWRFHRVRHQDRTGERFDSDYVKLPHHGSKADCQSDVLDRLCRNGGCSIISANGTSHPHKSVLSDLAERQNRILCTNMAKAWGDTADVVNLFRDTAMHPKLERLINEYGRVHSSIGSPCKGDITLSIDSDGSTDITTELNTPCLCDFVARGYENATT